MSFYKKKIAVLFFCLFIANFALSNAFAQNKGITNATKTLFSFNFPKAITQFKQVWEDENADKESKIIAAQKLAQIAWRAKVDFNTAKLWTDKAIKFDKDRADTYILISDIENDAGRYKEARQTIEIAINKSKTSVDKQKSVKQLALISITEAKESLLKGLPLNQQQILLDLEKLTNLTKDIPEDVELAGHQISLSILAMDWKNFAIGWKNYFRISDDNSPNEILSPPYKKLKKLLPQLKNNKLPSAKNTEALIELLGQSRLFRNAKMVSNVLGVSKASLLRKNQNYLTYATYLENIEDITFNEYQNRTLGKGNWKNANKKLIEEDKKLWKALNWQDKPKTFSRKAVADWTKKHFGAYRTTGIIANNRVFFVAHSVSDKTHEIEQYGQRVQPRFIVLDQVASMDFIGWFRKEPDVGGSAHKNYYLGYRRAILSIPMQVWYWVSDKTERERITKQIKELSASDLEIAKKNPHALLPGLRLKLQFRAFSEMYDNLVEKGLRGKKLKLKFLTDTEKFAEEILIIHEGRHLIDYQVGNFSSTELEYQAKLSELAFSSYPTANLSFSIYKANLGLNSPHGNAQLRLIMKLVKWMKTNSSQISDYDPSKPPIYQLDKLSNENLRNFARSADPLAKEKQSHFNSITIIPKGA